jgi:hypothetical protein
MAESTEGSERAVRPESTAGRERAVFDESAELLERAVSSESTEIESEPDDLRVPTLTSATMKPKGCEYECEHELPRRSFADHRRG